MLVCNIYYVRVLFGGCFFSNVVDLLFGKNVCTLYVTSNRLIHMLGWLFVVVVFCLTHCWFVTCNTVA